MCNCPECRRRRGEPARSTRSDTGYLFDIDPYALDEDDAAAADDSLDEVLLPDLPPVVLEMVIEEFKRAIARGEEPDIERVFERVSDELLDRPRTRTRQDKRPKGRR